MKSTCQNIVQQLPALQDGELPPEAEQTVRDHLRACPKCCQVRDALVQVMCGLTAAADRELQTGGLTAAVLKRLEAAPRARVSKASRIVRLALPLAAAAAVLVLVGWVWVHNVFRKAAPAPVALTVAPPVVVGRPATGVVLPQPSAVARPEGAEPPGMVVRRIAVSSEQPTAAGEPPAQVLPPVANLEPFQLGVRAAPVGRAFVIRNGQPQAYAGLSVVKLDPMPFGPAALRVDAFPREQPSARHTPATRKL